MLKGGVGHHWQILDKIWQLTRVGQVYVSDESTVELFAIDFEIYILIKCLFVRGFGKQKKVPDQIDYQERLGGVAEELTFWSVWD